MTIKKRRSGSERGAIGPRLEKVNQILGKSFGFPRRKADLPEPIDLLVATVLSQNTNDLNSHRAYVNLKQSFPNFLSLSSARPKSIESLIKVGGIANRKSKTIVKLVGQLKNDFGDFRRAALRKIEREELIDRLINLNGIGYKTATCVLLFALGDDDAFPVDTHIHRVLNRIGIVHTTTPDKTYLALKDSIPRGSGYQLHLNLIKFGRKTCTARNPKCFACPLYGICGWKEKSYYASRRSNEKNSYRVGFMHLEEI